jgi:hypothetical protein
MNRTHLRRVLLACAVSGNCVAAQGTATSSIRECPSAAVDTSAWLLTRDSAVGIEIKYPADYQEKHWESRSDSSGAQVAFWRDAVSTVEFNEFQGFWARRGPNPSVAPCLLRTRSAPLQLHLERTVRTLWTGRDTVYFVAKGVFRPAGRPRMLVELGAPDSTALLEQLAMLRTIRFLQDR